MTLNAWLTRAALFAASGGAACYAFFLYRNGSSRKQLKFRAELVQIQKKFILILYMNTG